MEEGEEVCDLVQVYRKRREGGFIYGRGGDSKGRAIAKKKIQPGGTRGILAQVVHPIKRRSNLT